MTSSQAQVRHPINFRAGRDGGWVIALCIAICAVPAFGGAGHPVATHAAHRPPVTTPPPSTGDGNGGVGVVGVGKQDGFLPQSLTPIGMPHTPPPPQSEWSKVKEKVLTALAAVDTSVGDDLAQAQAVRAVIQERDVRVASKNPPKHVALASK